MYQARFLKKSSEFQHIRETGKRCVLNYNGAPLFRCQLGAEVRPFARLGLSVSSVEGQLIRNRIRRICKSWFTSGTLKFENRWIHLSFERSAFKLLSKKEWLSSKGSHLLLETLNRAPFVSEK